jgi:hypothetical protein
MSVAPSSPEPLPPNRLRPYYAESWFTAEGARLKARRLQQAGMPDLTNWRFVTLTMATRRIPPSSAYQLGKNRLRRFLARFRQALGRPFRWCWKLEFHEDGYAHWHLLIEYPKPLPEEMLPELESWWGLGRVNVKRVKQREIGYVLKYVAKGPEDLPAWVMEHKGRLRVFQTSRGFFTRPKAKPREKQAPRTCLLPVSLRTRLQWDARKALLVEDLGDCRRISVVKLPTPFLTAFLKAAEKSLTLRQPLAVPGEITLSWRQKLEIQHETRKHRGLAALP